MIGQELSRILCKYIFTLQNFCYRHKTIGDKGEVAGALPQTQNKIPFKLQNYLVKQAQEDSGFEIGSARPRQQ